MKKAPAPNFAVAETLGLNEIFFFLPSWRTGLKAIENGIEAFIDHSKP